MTSDPRRTLGAPMVPGTGSDVPADAYALKVPDVPTAFDDVKEHGHKHGYKGEPWVGTMAESHVQGIAQYGDYLILTHNNKGYSRGWLLVIDTESGKLVQKIETHDAHYNHPGGCQTIGRYLAVAVENSDYDKSYIHFYDLSEMTADTAPSLLDYSLQRAEKGAGGVGITSATGTDGIERYVMAVHDNGIVDLYQSGSATLSDPDFGFVPVADGLKVDGYSEVCLVTDTSQNVYLIGFSTHHKSGKYKDYADLWSVTLGDEPSVTKVKFRHMSTRHGGIVGVDGVHFRWGGGLRVRPDLSLEFFASQRNFAGNEITVNTFEP